MPNAAPLDMLAPKITTPKTAVCNASDLEYSVPDSLALQVCDVRPCRAKQQRREPVRDDPVYLFFFGVG